MIALAEKPLSAEAAVAPGLVARPAQRLGDVGLGARAERVEAAVAVARPADLDEQVVEVGPGVEGARVRGRRG